MKISMLVESYLDFEQALYQFYDGDAPISTILSSIALCMTKSRKVSEDGLKSFRFPRTASTDGKDHYFYFEVGYCKVDREDVFEFVRWE